MSEVEKTNHVITQRDTADLQRIESEIENDQAAFLRVADNLIEIRERKLFLITADSFEEYIRIRWGWTKQRAYQIISAKKVVDSLPPNSQLLVDSETKARALAPVPVKRRARVITEAVKSTNGAVTARDITEAAERVTKPAPIPVTAPEPKKEQLLDATGYPVPDSVIKLFHRSDEVKDVLQRVATLRGMMRRLSEVEDALWQPVNKSTMGADLNKVYHELKMALPYAVCPHCQGRDETKSHCTTCKQRGVISEFLWKTAIPEELKAVRAKSCKR